MNEGLMNDMRGVPINIGDTIVSGFRSDNKDELEIDVVQSIDIIQNSVNVGGDNDILLDDTDVLVVPKHFREW